MIMNENKMSVSAKGLRLMLAGVLEIGRASCRERV